MPTSRLRPAVLSDDLAGSRAFYEGLLGLDCAFESEWYLEFVAADSDSLLGLELLKRGSPPLPEDYQRAAPGGLYLCFVVEEVDALHARATEQGVEVLQAPRDEAYGQRRMLLRAPEGTMVDVSSPVQGR